LPNVNFSIDWQAKTQSQVEEMVKNVALELRKEVCFCLQEDAHDLCRIQNIALLETPS
jgi:hypothetical protein